MTTTDKQLMQKAQQGDASVWGHIVEQHREAVFRLAYLLTGSAADAEDIAQETFIKAVRYAHRFDLSQPLKPWLLQIARNTARNRQRSLGRHLNALRRLWQNRLTDSSPSTAGHAAQQSRAQRLWAAVRQLDEADQEIIYVRHFMGLSTREAAHTLNIAEGTVKSRLHRALERLRGVIMRDFPDLMEDYDHDQR